MEKNREDQRRKQKTRYRVNCEAKQGRLKKKNSTKKTEKNKNRKQQKKKERKLPWKQNQVEEKHCTIKKTTEKKKKTKAT